MGSALPPLSFSELVGKEEDELREIYNDRKNDLISCLQSTTIIDTFNKKHPNPQFRTVLKLITDMKFYETKNCLTAAVEFSEIDRERLHQGDQQGTMGRFLNIYNKNDVKRIFLDFSCNIAFVFSRT